MEFISKLFINGEFREAISGEHFAVINPADMSQVGKVAKANSNDTISAIECADIAYEKFKHTTGKERSKILRKLAEIMTSQKEELAKIMVFENGKSIHEARNEVDYSISFVEWFSEEAKRIYGDIMPSLKAGQRLFNIKQPVGVVGAITPWNFPLAMIVRKLAPAIAAGCSIVLKPSEETPYSALKLAKLAQEAGLPNGIFNVVCGDAKSIGQALTDSSIIRMITFTGSTPVGKLLMEQSSKTVKKVTLELGGNAPFIVFDDANLDKAVDGLIASKLRNGGQSCICANRIYVAKNILTDFSTRLIKKYEKIKVGNGIDEANILGPLVNSTSVKKIESLMMDAAGKGSEILYSASIDTLKQTSECYVSPSVILNRDHETLIERSEIFGPIISMFAFDSEEEVLKRANSTNYGLASYFYSENKDRIWRVSESLEYGLVGVNDVALSSEVANFGGVKESGLGREGGRYGINEYLEDKYIVMS